MGQTVSSTPDEADVTHYDEDDDPMQYVGEVVPEDEETDG